MHNSLKVYEKFNNIKGNVMTNSIPEEWGTKRKTETQYHKIIILEKNLN